MNRYEAEFGVCLSVGFLYETLIVGLSGFLDARARDDVE